VFEWPSQAVIDEYLANGVLHPIVGFENNRQDGTGTQMNFILNNGDRSYNRPAWAMSDGYTYYAHMMPADSHKFIRSVEIFHFDDNIYGFRFFDREGHLMFKIGNTLAKSKVNTVALEDNEVIVGVNAKLFEGNSSRYSHF
jgi:hypothetical protein